MSDFSELSLLTIKAGWTSRWPYSMMVFLPASFPSVPKRTGGKSKTEPSCIVWETKGKYEVTIYEIRKRNVPVSRHLWVRSNHRVSRSWQRPTSPFWRFRGGFRARPRQIWSPPLHPSSGWTSFDWRQCICIRKLDKYQFYK